MSRWPIPESWEWATAGQLAEIVGGGTPPSKNPANFATKGIPWLTPADLSGHEAAYIERGARDLSEKGYAACGARLLPKRSVLYTSRAPIGYCVIAANEICTNQGFKSLVLFSDTSPEYIRYYFLASKEYAESLASGSTFLELSGRRMSELEVPVASAAEQRRIADKITILDSHSRAARKHLDAIPPLLEQFRASVLSAAFSGRLTADWREKQKRKGVKIESADALLDRMRVERRQRWEEEQLARMKAKGRKPKDDSWKAKYKEPEPVDTRGLSELPEGWCWAQGEDLFRWESGEFLPRSKQVDGPYPVYGGNGISGRHSEALCDSPTLVIGRVGANCGNAYSTDGPAWVTDNAIFASEVAPSIDLHFAQMAYTKADLRTRAGGSGQPFVNQTILNNTLIPLPPLAEQKEIARVYARSLATSENAGRDAASATDMLATLWQSVLEKAFRGELVPQNPKDEPATELLKRIAEEKEKMKANKEAMPRSHPKTKKGPEGRRTRASSQKVALGKDESKRPKPVTAKTIEEQFDEALREKFQGKSFTSADLAAWDYRGDLELKRNMVFAALGRPLDGPPKPAVLKMRRASTNEGYVYEFVRRPVK